MSFAQQVATAATLWFGLVMVVGVYLSWVWAIRAHKKGNGDEEAS
jgi:cbb3-type cytochrome oxidase subunit 3